MTVTYTSPSGHTHSITADHIGDLILTFPAEHWATGTGSATVRYENEHIERVLLILPNHAEPIIYLKWIERTANETSTYVVIFDADDLADHIECDEEWFASRGLFGDAASAASIASYFVDNDGLRMPGVRWSATGELPDEANW